MSLKDRIFDLVFPERRRRRGEDRRERDGRRTAGKGRKAEREEGYDSRYFVRRRR